MESNRKKAFQEPNKNPATKFISWKSNDKCFSYYDKEKGENISIPLPFRFLVLDELHTVSGWNDATSSGIYSNEVKYISKEVMTVKPFKGNEIAKGLYKDIKDKIQAAGGHYQKSIYVMLEDYTLANIQLKGSAVQAWGEFTQKSRVRLGDEWVNVADAVEGKKGAVKFYTPDFKYNVSLTAEEGLKADLVFNELEAYLKTYLAAIEPVVEQAVVEDDLDF
jgi:hypothetical protein